MANVDLDTPRQYRNVADQQPNDIYRRAAYYQYLADSSVTYEALAKGMVLDSTVSGIVVNNFLALRAQLDTASRSVADVLVELQGRIAGASIAC